jgi:hypothetical protein
MAENQTHESANVRDVFDVSTTADTSLGAGSEGGLASEAGMLAAPPLPEGASVEEGSLFSSLSVGNPSKPLLGRLPLARIIPQDVHSVMDYLDGGGVLAGAFLTSCPKAKAASWLLGGTGVAASSLTDYRLSLAKVIPIEAHETIDYAFGLSAVAAPFVLGYRKTAPLVAAMHVAIGVGTILASLFTDYRAYRGVGQRASA